MNLVLLIAIGIALLVGLGLVVLVGVVAGVGWAIGVLVLLLVVLGLAGGIFLFLKMLEKRRSRPFEEQLAASAAGGSGASAADLEGLRQNFLKGMQTFKEHGKDLYSLPWYIIAGEPGSGKTECLRHSEIEFPKGLTNELQGAGGTQNVDWWFTEQAVLLDTAGRMVVDGESGSRGEWESFLKMLGKHRPHCPINGLMLAIPADTLIKDSADEIERKAQSIAHHIHQLVRTLDVRFPVYLLVTKADLINGFREFFEAIDDPRLANQMMGWSNPDDLDVEFNPANVEDCLLEVQDRLVRRRGGLLADPKPRGAGVDQRVDEVDALFAFPEALVTLAPRVRFYLDHVLPTGQWSAKPLFLRGIYFVSSMRDGAALDADLAAAMEVSVDDLPEGKTWDRDKSYFIRDLFVDKIFKERGLVTRASNTKSVKGRRKLIVAGVTSVAALFVLLLTLVQFLTLQKTLGGPALYWKDAATVFGPEASDPPTIVSGRTVPASYTGDELLPGSTGDLVPKDEPKALVGMQARLAEQVEARLRVPLLFQIGSADLDDNIEPDGRREAAKAMVTRSTLGPLLAVTERSLSRAGDADSTLEWDSRASAALAELVRTHRSTVTGAEPVQIAPLLEFVVAPENDEERDRLRREAEAYQLPIDAIYNAGKGDWPKSTLEAGALGRLERAVAAFEVYCRSRFEPGDSEDAMLSLALRLGESLKQYHQAEDRVLQQYGPIDSDSTLKVLVPWETGYQQMERSYRRIERVLTVMSARNETRLQAWVRSAAEGEVSQLGAEIDAVIDAFGTSALDRASGVAASRGSDDDAEGEEGTEPAGGRSLSSDVAGGLGSGGTLDELRSRLRTLKADLETTAARITADAPTYAVYDEQDLSVREGRSLINARHEMYRRVDAVATGNDIIREFIELPTKLGQLERDIANAKKQNEDEGLPTGNSSDRQDRGIKASAYVLNLIRLNQREQRLIEQAAALQRLPESRGEIEEAVARYAGAATQIAVPRVPLTTLADAEGEVDTSYHPDGGPLIVRVIRLIEDELESGTRADQVRATTLRGARESYARVYLDYWEDLPDKVLPFDPNTRWSDWQTSLRSLRPTEVFRQMGDLNDLRLRAISALDVSSPDDWGNPMRTQKDVAFADVESANTQLAIASNNNLDSAFLGGVARLGNNAGPARTTLLRQQVLEFQQGVGAAFNDGRGNPFWHMVSLRTLQTLEAELNREAIRAEAVLADLQRFPLARLPRGANLERLSAGSPGENRVLSPDEVLTAEQNLRLVLPTAGAVQQTGEFGPGTVGGATTPIVIDNRVTEALRRLQRGPDQQKLRTFRQMRELALAFSGDLKATLSLAGTDEQPPGPTNGVQAIRLYNYVAVGQGRDVLRQADGVNMNVDEDKELADIEIPGDGVLISFWETNTDPAAAPDGSLSLKGPWSLLAFMDKFNAEPSDDNPNVWLVDYLFDIQGVPAVLRFKVDFGRTLPEFDEWPVTAN